MTSESGVLTSDGGHLLVLGVACCRSVLGKMQKHQRPVLSSKFVGRTERTPGRQDGEAVMLAWRVGPGHGDERGAT